ncbi:MAG TPA: ATP-binding protein, partial [Myxococcota bacterium]|nr:ATP-binding protein [Myxococcota bacterium]
LQALLGDAVQRVQRISAATRVVAWVCRDGGAPYVAAAAFRGDPPLAPDASELHCLSTLPGVTPLDGSADRLALGRRHGVSVALPIPHEPGEAAVVLLLGPEQPAPRVLAQLKREAQRLRAPIASALAVARVERLDRSVQQLNRLASLGALATEIAHEIRNPLVSMKTFLQLLPERWGDPDFSESFLALVADELRRMERLLDLVIEHARPGGDSADHRPTDVGPAIAANLSLLEHRARKRDVALEASAARDLPAIALSEDRLRQVLLNLLLNAIDATPPGGRVSVSAKRVGDSVEIAVCDDGPGIPPELRGEIFEPFFSTRAHSAGGLGLAIARRIVRDAGGELRVRARRAGGAEFALRIAAAEPPDPPAAREPE